MVKFYDFINEVNLLLPEILDDMFIAILVIFSLLVLFEVINYLFF